MFVTAARNGSFVSNGRYGFMTRKHISRMHPTVAPMPVKMNGRVVQMAGFSNRCPVSSSMRAEPHSLSEDDKCWNMKPAVEFFELSTRTLNEDENDDRDCRDIAVSYTHLTLPTTYPV